MCGSCAIYIPDGVLCRYMNYIYLFGCSEATFGAVFEVEDLDAVELLSAKENKDERPRGGVSW